jgi:hypothetical protein
MRPRNRGTIINVGHQCRLGPPPIAGYRCNPSLEPGPHRLTVTDMCLMGGIIGPTEASSQIVSCIIAGVDLCRHRRAQAVDPVWALGSRWFDADASLWTAVGARPAEAVAVP